jgi:hypothetical protein
LSSWCWCLCHSVWDLCGSWYDKLVLVKPQGFK